MTYSASIRAASTRLAADPLADILAELPPGDAAAILDALRNDIDAALADLQDAWRLGEAPVVRRAAHRLAGLFAHCGAALAATLASRISATTDDLDTVELAPKLIAEGGQSLCDFTRRFDARESHDAGRRTA